MEEMERAAVAGPRRESEWLKPPPKPRLVLPTPLLPIKPKPPDGPIPVTPKPPVAPTTDVLCGKKDLDKDGGRGRVSE